jgi:hypothetical protein
MSTGKFVGRVGALAVALGVGFTTGNAPGVPMAGAADSSSSDSTALVVCGLGCPTPDAYFVDSMMNQFVTPTHPGQTLTPVGVTGPTDSFPLLGILRLIVTLTGDPKVVPNLWPDEPWWKLTGLFDRTNDQSVTAGVSDLEAAMAAHGNDHLVIAGESGGAAVVVAEKRKLAAQYPQGTTAPDISFVLVGDPSVPNGGLNSRFPGLPTFFLGTFTSAEPTDTQFHTDVIIRQYDMASDFPLYPLNIVADLNAVLGFFYVHTYPFDVGLPADPTTSPAYQGTHGDSSYYFFPTDELPLFAPLRQLGVPEGLIDVVEPFFRVLVEMGYDRSIPAWEPTPARLIPALDLARVVTDLADAVGEGANNAVALVNNPSKLIPTTPPPIVANVATLVSMLQTLAARQTPTTTVSPIEPAAGGLPSNTPAPVTLAPLAPQTVATGISAPVTSSSMPTQTEQVTSAGAAIGTRQVSTVTTTSTTVTGTDQTAAAQSATDTEQPTSPKNATESAKATSAAARAVEPSTRPTSEASAANAVTTKPAKPRPVVRDSLGAGRQLPGRSHRREGDQPTSRTAAAGAEATTGEPSSTASSSAASSSTGSSSGGSSLGGDGDGS